jgi:hypothetical protein
MESCAPQRRSVGFPSLGWNSGAVSLCTGGQPQTRHLCHPPCQLGASPQRQISILLSHLRRAQVPVLPLVLSRGRGHRLLVSTGLKTGCQPTAAHLQQVKIWGHPSLPHRLYKLVTTSSGTWHSKDLAGEGLPAARGVGTGRRVSHCAAGSQVSPL